MNVNRDNLKTVMEFDHVIRVHADGTVTDEAGTYAPCLDADELDSPGWTLLNGYSGQYRYAGPIMHNSEYIGGRLADDILSTPGVYVALVNYDVDGGDGEGWAVACLDDSGLCAARPTCAGGYRHTPDKCPRLPESDPTESERSAS